MTKLFSNQTIIFFIFFKTTLIFSTQNAFALFEDEDARRAILEIREKIIKLEKNTEELAEQIESSTQGRLKLSSEIDQLNSELSLFRGFKEEYDEFNNNFSSRLDQIEESIDLIVTRITALEPQSVIVAGREILVETLEKKMYENASELMNSGNYSAAIQQFERFNRKYKESTLTAYALHAKGLSYYAIQAYPSAIETLQMLEKQYLSYPRLADAMLTLAASQTEANKVEDAIKTLQTLIKRSPSSDAALTARERIKQLKPSKS